MSTEQSAASSLRMMSEMSTMPATRVGPRGSGGGGAAADGGAHEQVPCTRHVHVHVGRALTLVIEVDALDGRERLGARGDGGLQLHGVG